TIFFRSDIDRLFRATILACQITHFDPRCVEACVVLNFALEQCLAKRLRPDTFVEQAIGLVRSVRQTDFYRQYVLDFDIDQARAHPTISPYTPYAQDRDGVPEALATTPRMRHRDLRAARRAVATMHLGIWSLLHTHTYEETIRSVVLLGG